MLLRPPKPVTESIAVVSYSGSLLRAYLPEKNDRFRAVMKNRGLTWDWVEREYSRLLEKWAGPTADRAAELGHVLLNAGFSVEIADDLAQMILAVSYEPEKRRRIVSVVAGRHTGWLAVLWPRDDDHWQIARRLPGSRYSKPHLVVPPDQFEAILDFAERYDFHITRLAREALDAAAARKRAALIVDLPLPDTRAQQAASSSPTTVDGIDLELVDDDLDDDH